MNPPLAQVDLSSVTDAAPLALQAVLIVMLLVGLAVWVLGRKLARVGVALTGLVVGGVLVAILGRSITPGSGAMTLAWIVAGALIGCLGAWLLYRIWMGVSLAVILALVAPAAAVIWQGTPPPPTDLTIDTDTVAQAQEQGPAASVRGIYEHQEAAVRAWWKDLGPAAQRFVLAAAGVGALAGLVLGLMLPNLAAAWESALAGTVLMFTAVRHLLPIYAPDSDTFLPTEPRSVLLTIGLITAAGFLLQSTIWRRKADND